MRNIFALFAALCLLVLVVPLALAQSAPIERPVILVELWAIIQPLVVLFVSTVGPALITWLSLRLVALLKITDENAKKELEAKIRAALHEAALNGLKLAMTRAGLPSGAIPGGSVITEAVEYIRKLSPETAVKAGVDDYDLAEIVLSKVPDVMAITAATKATR